ncbi:MAG: sigma 54-interacting transcriptional regulator [Chitinophagaceae bacterium]|nr:sigma 54-interacting transcriptional regulator [Chitinophagaceae bacterium]
MKKAENIEKKQVRKLQAAPDESKISTLGLQLDAYKKEKDILLALSNDITRVRDKNDLIIIFKQRIKGLFHITHSIVTLINDQEQTYIPFLLDNTGSPIRSHERYKEMVLSHFSLNEPFIQAVLAADEPVSFVLEEIMDLPGRPAFLRVNYERGVREIMMTKLMKEGKPMGFIHTYTDNAEGFSKEFRNLMKGIAPQLSSAVSNIIKNEEIQNKEKEKSFLLDFSSEIATVRTKEELASAVGASISKLNQKRGYIIRRINDDDVTMSPYVFDMGEREVDPKILNAILSSSYPINDGIQDRVLNSPSPVLLNVEKEIQRGIKAAYLDYWKKMGFENLVAVRLRTGETNLGILLLDIDEINVPLLQGICAQISIAISNVRSIEELERRQEEKSILLELSDEIAALRSRSDLLHVANTKIKKLLSIHRFGIMQIDGDGATYSVFMLDHDNTYTALPEFAEIYTKKYPVSDKLFHSLMKSEQPIIWDVSTIAEDPVMPAYVGLWKKVGLKQVLGNALRAGGKNVGAVLIHLEAGHQVKLNLAKAISSQLAVAVSNILANEQIARKQAEQTFLIGFSHDITRVRTKQDLQDAISTVLNKTMNTQFVMIRVIEDDGKHLLPFMFDRTLFEKANAKVDFDKMAKDRITIEETYTAQVLASQDGILFNVEEELKSGNLYAKLWKTTGLRNMYGLPLRMGNKNIGTIWMLADRLSSLLLNGICAQISIAIDNIQANEKLLAYKKGLEVENDYLKEQIKTIYFTDIIGSADEMQKVYRLMSLVAETNTTVLLTGETGTGKELIARAVHNSSPRRDKLMVKVNCAALPANLIESELFGHERGAFTGAIDRRIGKFELANNSTLFLDEIGELPLEAQAKLLRVIQERELERLGGKQIIKIDVRLIAATNRILEDEVKAGRFRADLYFRLNVFPIQLPPLRNRAEDIEPLTHFFISKYSRNTGRKIRIVSPKVLQQLRSYTWPGNVRELEHLIERSILLATDGELNDVFIPESTDGNKKSEAFLLNRSLEDVERSYIIETLKRCAGKISGTGSAAEILKIPGNTLHSKMKKLGINKGDYFAS